MDYEPKKQGTLLLPSGPNGMHLFIIINDKCQNNQHLLLSITTIREGVHHDATTVLEVGDHPFIRHPSFIYPEQRRTDLIKKNVLNQLFIPKEDLEDAVFSRVCDGIEQSDFSPPWAIRYYLETK